MSNPIMVMKIPDGMKPTIVPAHDANGNVFEAYLLRHAGRSIAVDVRAAEALGGICVLRNGISPWHEIVCEVLV